MVDVHDKDERRRNMSAIRSSGTKPEQIILAMLDDLGVAYKTQVKGLPSKPDIVIDDRKCVLLVQGCFWHGHQCELFRVPGTRKEFWVEKINSNISRDCSNIRALIQLGYRVLLVWECALKGKRRLSLDSVQSRIEEFILADAVVSEIDSSGISNLATGDLSSHFKIIG